MDIRSRVKIAVRGLSRRVGVDLIKALDDDHFLKRRVDLIRAAGASLVLDIGAGAGQYVMTMRGLGYAGPVVSLEPVLENYKLLERSAASDASWKTVHAAVGLEAGLGMMHVAKNGQSSSFLPMLDRHLEAAPDSRYVRDEQVRVVTLASVIDQHVGASDRAFLKLDTQGTELGVLMSAARDLERVVGIQVELSTVPLYDGQPLLETVLAEVRGLGFAPASFEPDFWDASTGRLLQLDGIFFRD